jgi:glycosyltransferase involved in cell wall biosynthesis
MPLIVGSPAYPRPPIDGDKVRWSALLAELARLEPAHGVFGYMPWLGERRDPEFERLFASIDVVDTTRFEVTARAALLAIRRQPSAFGRRATPGWRRAVSAAASRHPHDPLLLLGTSAGFIAPIRSRTVLDLVDVRSRVRTLAGDRIISGSVLKAELALTREHMVVLACDSDRRWLLEHGAHPDRIAVVPHGVDRRFFEVRPAASPPTILFVGSLRYPPNRAAIDWFLEQCWPLLRRSGARLRIVGYGAERIASAPGLEIHADVDDVLPHYAVASLAIAPLLEARGTQFKVLEAMASGVPVACTTPVARGLFDDHPARVADDPKAFIDACKGLLEQPPEAAELGRRGREYVRQRHDWAGSARELRGALFGAHSA